MQIYKQKQPQRGDFVMKYIFISLALLIILTGCKYGSNPTRNTTEISPTPTQNPTEISPSPTTSIQIPSPSPASIVFGTYKDHVDPNPEIMSLDERKTLNTMGQELISLLDDYVYDFNYNRKETGNSAYKFNSMDTPAEVLFGKGILKIKATNKFKVLNETQATVIAYAEVRKHEGDPKPIWKGTQLFKFSIMGGPDPLFKLSYWNDQTP
jgi:hypothetical protein